MSERKLGGAVPGEFDDDGPDTNVDERPVVVPSALEADADGDTNVDEAPTIDPTTRRPPPRVRVRPIKERNSRRPAAPRAPPPPPADAPKPGKLKLPLPPGVGPRKSEQPPAPVARPPVLDEPPPVEAPPPRHAPRSRHASEARKAVPTYAGEHKSAKWPFVAAVVLVGTVLVAFLVGSEMNDPDDPATQIAAQRRRAAQSAAKHNHLVAANDHAGHGHQKPTAVRDPSMPSAPAREGTIRAPAIAAKRDRSGVGLSIAPDAPSGHDLSDKGENQPHYNEKDPEPTVPMLKIATKPSGIPVFIDGIPVGATPVLMPLPKDHKGGTIEFKKAGFVTTKKPYSVDGAGTYEVYQEVEVDPTFAERMKKAAAEDIEREKLESGAQP